MLYCIVGPSGSGKTTLVERLNELGYKSPDSYTTRPPRYNGEKGHTFISKKDFDFLPKVEKVLAYTKFNGYEYCVTDKMLEFCTFYVIDPKGIKSLKENYNNEFKTIGLKISPNECKKRMLKRGDTEQEVNKRLDNDNKEFKNYLNMCDFIIDATNDIDTNIDKILKYINN